MVPARRPSSLEEEEKVEEEVDEEEADE